MTNAIEHFSTRNKEHFINDAQWATLARLHMRSEISIQEILDGLNLQPNIDMPDKKQNFVGRIPCGKNYSLYGMIHYTGTTHT
jgi:hypothetical protein